MNKLKEHKSFNGFTEFWEHDSKATKTKMKFSTYKPEGEIKGGLIWLSGLTCNEENFITKAGAQRVLSELKLAIICPDTSPRGLDLKDEHESYDFGSGAGFYVDAKTEGYSEHYNMSTYINDEVYDLFNKEFSLDNKISIFGHSMGGHGALTLGLKNPDKYKSISAFSPIVNPVNCQWGKKAFSGYLGEENEKEWKEHDATELILADKKHKNTILVEQGQADDFYPDQLLTNNFKEACLLKGQSVEINMQEGFDHSYYFISTFIESHLKFHSKFF